MEKYNKLTVLSTFKKPRNTKGYRLMANCLCGCGNTCVVQLDNLKSGHTKSCGCEKTKNTTKHGFWSHKMYWSLWRCILRRCYNENEERYKNYGGRGIKVCDEWLNDPGKFFKWALENGWKKGLTIERKDVNGNYEPSNCCFVTRAEQAKNTTRTIKITYKGVTDSLRGMAIKYGINYSFFRYHYQRGVPVDAIIYNNQAT